LRSNMSPKVWAIKACIGFKKIRALIDHALKNVP